MCWRWELRTAGRAVTVLGRRRREASAGTRTRALSSTGAAAAGGALAGVRVLDLSRVLAGPWCTQQLADHGAQSHLSAYFLACNRAKLSCCIDFKSARGRELVLGLAKRSHVLVENFLPGELDRLGLGFDTVHAVAPHCHYASLTSYGRSGPLSSRAGYDVTIAGEGGLLSLTGSEAEPARGGVALTDIATGYALCTAVLAALFHDRRPGRGADEPVQGQRIETSLFATQVALLSSIGQSALLDPAYESRRYGTAHPSIVPYQCFSCADGRLVVVGAVNDRQFAALSAVLGRPELASDPRFLTNPLRVRNRQPLLEAVSAELRTAPADDWVRRLDEAQLPCAHINDVRGVMEHPQTKELGIVQEVQQRGEDEKVRMIGPNVSMSITPPAIRGGAPALAEHTDWVMQEILGLTDAQIAQMKSDRIIQ